LADYETARRLRELEESQDALRRDLSLAQTALAAQADELRRVQAAPPKPPPAPPPPAKPPVSAALPIKIGASVTLRYDRSTTEDQTDLYLDDDTFIHGLRTRVRLSAEYSDPDSPLLGGLRLSTGENPNPTVPFVGLSDAFRSRPFGLDQAYFGLRPFANRDLVTATFGKMPNPFFRGRRGPFRSEIVWDDDVNPEGIALRIQLFRNGRGDSAISVDDVGGYFILGDIPTTRFTGIAGPVYLWADQLKVEVPYLAAAVAYYAYENLNSGLSSPSNVVGQAASLTPATNSFLLRTGLQTTNNRLNYGPGADGFIVDHFRIFQATAQAHLPLQVIPQGGDQEVFLIGDFVHNGAVRRDHNGYSATLGLRAGGYDNAAFNPANLWLTYRDVQADATLATVADSDLGGGTDYKGFELAGNYRFLKNLMAQFSYFTFEGYPRQDNRIQRFFLDLTWDY
jgi:hypothetical protein